MKKLISGLLAVLLITVSLAGCGSSGTPTSQASTESQSTGSAEAPAAESTDDLPSYTFKLGFNTVEDSVRGEMAKAFKAYVEEESGGRIKVELYPAETMGNEQEMTEMVKLGTLDFSLPGCSNMSNVDVSFSAISLPFLVKDFDQGHALLDGELGDRYKALSAAQGYKILSFGDLGMAQITNGKTAINSLEDMRGLKMRSPNEGPSIKTFESLGCSVTTLPFSELYLGLSQGVVDGQFNPIDAIYQQKFYEVQDYLAVVNIFYYAINFIMSDEKFESYDAETQRIILEGALEAQEASRVYAAEADEMYLALMQEEFVEITYPDTTAFQEAAKVVYDDLAETADSQVMEIVSR